MSTKQQQLYLIRILWREALRADHGDPSKASALLPTIMRVLGVRVVVQ